MSDGRPHYPNDTRDLAPALARIAVFIVANGPGPEPDKRPDADKLVSGCEGGSYLIPAREGHSHG
jgi:hypothetical protein